MTTAASAPATASAPTTVGIGPIPEISSTAVVATVCVIAVIFFVGWLLLRLPRAEDIETQKIRFAAATFTGILMVFVFAAALYFVDARPVAPGKDIFDKAMTAMTPLLGVVIGYLFGAKEKALPGKKDEKATGTTTQEKPKET